jgi:hypothetical protein
MKPAIDAGAVPAMIVILVSTLPAVAAACRRDGLPGPCHRRRLARPRGDADH